MIDNDAGSIITLLMFCAVCLGMILVYGLVKGIVNLLFPKGGVARARQRRRNR
jgi:hypothetical protein